MTASTLFYSIIFILIISFIIDKFLDALNTKRYSNPIPQELHDVYDQENYLKSQRYKKANDRFSSIASSISLIVTLLFFYLDGFAFLDEWARTFSDNSIIIALIFFGSIMFASDLLSTPFGYYHTFIIEEKFGFNKTSLKTFFLDKIKGWLMSAVLGGLLLSTIIWFYESTGSNFWIYAWGIITVVVLFMNLFYARLIVPLFNKQTPLSDGSLKTKIKDYAQKVGFQLDKIVVIDGSKRSTKANAYFSGFGSEKRVTLFDTLINDLEEEEIVAVLAHEVGHYKKKHILFNLIISTLIMGFTFWVLSLFIGSPLLSEALNVSTPSFHIGLIAFGILYSPISELTGLVMNFISRKFEYQADNYAKETFDGAPLISGLKKLNKNSLSNLTPHPAYVFVHYSHPTLLQRYVNLTRQ
ncbi:MAG: M48 family peptidase [Flavobacteriales bacterium]|nr:MAG: M48 family peptidase [Flavobacteriales bacterium]